MHAQLPAYLPGLIYTSVLSMHEFIGATTMLRVCRNTPVPYFLHQAPAAHKCYIQPDSINSELHIYITIIEPGSVQQIWRLLHAWRCIHSKERHVNQLVQLTQWIQVKLRSSNVPYFNLTFLFPLQLSPKVTNHMAMVKFNFYTLNSNYADLVGS